MVANWVNSITPKGAQLTGLKRQHSDALAGERPEKPHVNRLRERFDEENEIRKGVLAGMPIGPTDKEILTDALFFTCAMFSVTGETNFVTIQGAINRFLENGASPISKTGRTLTEVFKEDENTAGMQAVISLHIYDKAAKGAVRSF